MYFGVIHHIDDKVLWAKNIEEYDEASIPAGFANPMSCVAADQSQAFCLWTGPSIEELRPWLDAATSGARNEYWEIDPEAPGTIGVPTGLARLRYGGRSGRHRTLLGAANRSISLPEQATREIVLPREPAAH